MLSHSDFFAASGWFLFYNLLLFWLVFSLAYTGTAEYKQLRTELKETQREKEKLAEKASKTAEKIDDANNKIEEQEKKLSELSIELKAAGINTDNLSTENEKLKKTYDDLKKSQENFARANSDLEKNKQAISATKTELLKTVGATTALGAAIYVPVKGAMEFESSMADVAKVVDWIGTGNNATAEQIQQYNELSDGLYGLTRQIPMTAKEFAEISAAAGQANVALDNAELLKFAEDAAKMGIAFDVSAEQAGDFMAKWRTSFKMTQDEVVALSDIINYLGNTTPATAAQISDVVTRIGPLGEVAGLASGDIAALGAAIVGVGIGEDVAATGIKNLMLDMTKGTATTKKMNDVLASMGIDATDLAERMQTDASGAIMDFMRALQQLPAAEQAAALNNYFGQESVGAIAPLLSNLGNLEAQFNKVSDATQYAGSMEAEYAARAATSENTVQIMKNAIKELSDTFGNVFVPSAQNGAQALTEVIYKVTDFIKENGETIKTVTAVVATLLAAKTAYLGIKTVVLSVIGVYKGIKVAIAAYQLVQAAAAAGTSVWTVVSGAAATSTWALAGAFLAAAWPVLAIVAAIAVVIAIVVLLVKHWDKVKAAAVFVWNTIKDTFGKIGAFFAQVWEAIKSPFVSAFTWFNDSVIQPIINVFEPIVLKIGEIFSKIWEIITVLFGVLATWFYDNVINPIVEYFTPIIKTIGDIFQNIWNAISGVFIGVAGWFSDRFTEAWEAIKTVFSTVGAFFKGVWDSIVSIFTSIGTAVGNAIGDAFKFVVNSVIGFAEGLINKFVDGINNAISIINKIPGVSIEPLALLSVPRLAKGSDYTPDTFIAGERGAELITNARGRKVFTAAETGAIFSNIKTAREEATAPVIPAIIKRVKERINTLFTSTFTATENTTESNSSNSIIKMPDIINRFNISGAAQEVTVQNRIGETVKPLLSLMPPMYAKGSNCTPDTFIAGERGAELITNARGRKVFTAAETSKILSTIKTAETAQVAAGRTPAQIQAAAGRTPAQIQAAAGRTPAQVQAAAGRTPAQLQAAAGRTPAQVQAAAGRTPAQVQAAAGRTPAQIQAAYKKNNASVSDSDTPKMPTIAERVGGLIGALRVVAENRTIESAPPLPAMPETRSSGSVPTFVYSPTIQIGGNEPQNIDDIRALLKEHGEEMFIRFKEFLRGQRDDARRMDYA